jgi:hypothetical protein
MDTKTTDQGSPSFGDRVKNIWHEGAVRHVIVRKGDQRPVDLPLTAVVISAILAPWLLAIGVVVAIVMGYKMETERHGAPPPETPEGPPIEGPVEATGEPPPEG